MFSFGDAKFYGSTGGKRLNAPVFQIAATPDGGGYWLAGADGGVFSFGDAGFFGSAAGSSAHLPRQFVPTPDGAGYNLILDNGGVATFGDAKSAGGLGSFAPSTPVVGVAVSSFSG